VLAAEFSLVRNAFFTDPRDQSCWLYHRWLLSRVVAQLPQMPSLLIALGQADEQQSSASSSPPSASASSSPLEPLVVFDRELTMCRELDAVEANCKWTLLTIALLLAGREAVSRAQQEQQQQQQSAAAAASVSTACSLPSHVVTELAALFQRLIALDPMRTAYYRDVHRGLTSSIGSPSA
jgi:geranylgeranyl transferase type-2 subunit alpha